MYQTPSRASRTGTLASRGAPRKCLSCTEQPTSTETAEELRELHGSPRRQSWPRADRRAYHPVSSGQQLLKVLKA